MLGVSVMNSHRCITAYFALMLVDLLVQWGVERCGVISVRGDSRFMVTRTCYTNSSTVGCTVMGRCAHSMARTQASPIQGCVFSFCGSVFVPPPGLCLVVCSGFTP